MQALIQTLQEEFYDILDLSKTDLERKIEFPEIPNKIKVAVGIRRTGKTHLLFQVIRKLLQKGVTKSRILYLNFEDDRLLPIPQQKAANLIESFYSLYPENHNQLCYIFLDEIQNVEDWPVLVRRFFDTKRIQIYLSGSSSKLLSKEIATALRSRCIATEVWPLSFNEYLNAKQLQLSKTILGKKSQDQLKQLLLNYLTKGGFPEIISLKDAYRNKILQDYVSVVITRDILERHNIKQGTLIRYIIKTLLKNVATNFSTNKFYNDLKSNGYSIGKDTLYEYLGYIEDSYLALTVPIYTESIRKMHANPKKCYAVDSGLVNAYNISFSNNLGRLFENLIYLDLRRRGDEMNRVFFSVRLARSCGY